MAAAQWHIDELEDAHVSFACVAAMGRKMAAPETMWKPLIKGMSAPAKGRWSKLFGAKDEEQDSPIPYLGAAQLSALLERVEQPGREKVMSPTEGQAAYLRALSVVCQTPLLAWDDRAATLAEMKALADIELGLSRRQEQLDRLSPDSALEQVRAALAGVESGIDAEEDEQARELMESRAALARQRLASLEKISRVQRRVRQFLLLLTETLNSVYESLLLAEDGPLLEGPSAASVLAGLHGLSESARAVQKAVEEVLA